MTTAHAVDCEHARGAPARTSWARLLERVLDFDVERCVCGGKLKIIAAIEAPAVIERILTHLELSAKPPPRAPVRRFDLFQAVWFAHPDGFCQSRWSGSCRAHRSVPSGGFWPV